MAVERTLHPEWRDQQDYSRYPFADSASLTTEDGYLLSPQVFLDASLHPIGAEEQVGLSKIVVNNNDITLYLGDSGTDELASVTFDRLDPPEVLEFRDAYKRPAGVLVSETLRLASFQVWEAGTHLFDLGAAAFVASVVVPMPAIGVRGFILPDGQIVTGDVLFVGGDGVIIDNIGSGPSINIVGDPLFKRRLCMDNAELFQVPNFVRTINGQEPDAGGDFKLVAGDNLASDQILRIIPDGPDGIRIEAVGPKIAGE